MIRMIAAVAENGAIGKDNKIPWHLPEDFKLFKRLTQGNAIIMGLNTYRSIGRPLPGRHNIVLSRKPLSIEGCTTCTSIAQAIEQARSTDKDVYVCGGASLYEACMGLAQELCISHVHKEHEGDTFFPKIEDEEWKPIEEEEHEGFTFRRYTRRERA